MPPSFRTRFAPSPTGLLHLGHAFSALTASAAAQAAGGELLLRIEDIDQARCRPQYEAAIREDLAWLGIKWTEPVRRQSDHAADYAAVIDNLAARGLVYRCFKTRREILDDIARAPHRGGEGPDGVIYFGPETSKDPDRDADLLAAGAPYAWRLSLRAARAQLGADYARLGFWEEGDGPARRGFVPAQPERLGDVILARKDALSSYHLACVHDDAAQGVTHIIRGVDLCEATHAHVLLHKLMGWPTPIYRHHRLILGPDGKRYAKRDQAVTLAALRAAGRTLADIRDMVGL